MSRPEKAEPSMDEILASIRRIIAEEPIGTRGANPDAGKAKPAAGAGHQSSAPGGALGALGDLLADDRTGSVSARPAPQPAALQPAPAARQEPSLRLDPVPAQPGQAAEPQPQRWAMNKPSAPAASPVAGRPEPSLGGPAPMRAAPAPQMQPSRTNAGPADFGTVVPGREPAVRSNAGPAPSPAAAPQQAANIQQRAEPAFGSQPGSAPKLSLIDALQSAVNDVQDESQGGLDAVRPTTGGSTATAAGAAPAGDLPAKPAAQAQAAAVVSPAPVVQPSPRAAAPAAPAVSRPGPVAGLPEALLQALRQDPSAPPAPASAPSTPATAPAGASDKTIAPPQGAGMPMAGAPRPAAVTAEPVSIPSPSPSGSIPVKPVQSPSVAAPVAASAAPTASVPESKIADGKAEASRPVNVADAKIEAVAAAPSAPVAAAAPSAPGASAPVPAAQVSAPSEAGSPVSAGSTEVAPKMTILAPPPTAAQVRTLEDTVAELLRPMLREWLDAHMPRIVEKALRIEVAESFKKGAPVRKD